MSGLNSSREKDLWYTHLFLILGLSITYFYFEGCLANVSLVLVLGDAMAALIGRRYGKNKVYGKKTLEGYLAFVATTCLSLYLGGLVNELDVVVLAGFVCGGV